MLVADVIARLKAGVPDLGNRVEGAGALAALSKSGGVPQAGLVAYVVPTGIAGGKAFPLTGIYRQAIDRLISVLLVINTGHAQGGSLGDRMEALTLAIINALVGWQPEGATGVVTLRRAQLIDATGGVYRHEITFAAEHELRIL
jgi:hypothetical protein